MAENEDAPRARKERAARSRAAQARQRTGWSERVALVGGPDGFAYAPHDVVTTGGQAAREIAARVYPADKIEIRELSGEAGYQQLSGVPDPLRLIGELRRAGIVAQPNHVFFTHSCECCCGPHPSQTWGGVAGCGAGVHGTPVYASPVYASPVYASPVYASPVYASPVYASPVYASPVYASPVYASPVYASPVYASPVYASPVYASPVYASPVYASPVYASAEQATGRRPSSARPAVEPWVSIATERVAVAAAASTSVPVVVLDTGLAMAAFHSTAVTSLLPLLSATASDGDQPDDDADDDLDPAAGHGTFIAGLIEQVAPGTAVTLQRVLHAEGDGDEVQIAAAIEALPDPPATGALLNLSFGGYAMEQAGLLAAAVARAQARGYVVVASAGNDGTCRPTLPASLPEVVSVGAIGPNGPAPFSNYGSWVRACAPGVDLVSTFFAGWNGDDPAGEDGDPDDYTGWACWSGTSFAAPVVVGALAREMANGASAVEAVTWLIDHPALLRIPGLGTVINVL